MNILEKINEYLNEKKKDLPKCCDPKNKTSFPQCKMGCPESRGCDGFYKGCK